MQANLGRAVATAIPAGTLTMPVQGADQLQEKNIGDGLNIRQGACGQLFGYVALPLTPMKLRHMDDPQNLK